MRLYHDGICEDGNREGVNQDAIAMFQKGDSGLFLVADGMGGHSRGERASHELQRACTDWWRWYEGAKIPDPKEVERELKQMLSQANQVIWDETEEGQLCGSTVVLLWISGKQYRIFWCGDSRVYMAQQEFVQVKVRQLTVDDVWENQPRIAGNLTKQEMKVHPDYGKLVRAVGVDRNLACSSRSGGLKRTTFFLLCSDGVYKYVREAELERVIRSMFRNSSIKKGLNEIKWLVYQNQAPDNFSCIIVKAG